MDQDSVTTLPKTKGLVGLRKILHGVRFTDLARQLDLRDHTRSRKAPSCQASRHALMAETAVVRTARRPMKKHWQLQARFMRDDMEMRLFEKQNKWHLLNMLF